MKKIKTKLLSALSIVMVLGLICFLTITHVFAQSLKVFQGNSNINWSKPRFDPSKKTVFVIAANEGTEMFDLMSPFYLFNSTEKANVYVVSEKKAPVLLVNSLFILPHYSFREIDSLHLIADVIVIPNVTTRLKSPPKATIVNWIKSQFASNTILLAVCDGSATAAATGLYDGKPLTTHASDYKKLKKQFPKAGWVQNLSFTHSGNLYSTGGVSNATDGSLAVIQRLFGEETMQMVRQKIYYPHPEVKLEHRSDEVGLGTITRIASKVIFGKKHKIGVLLHDGIDEFELASILDTYVRTYPTALNSFSLTPEPVTSKYSLQLYATGDVVKDKVDEVHLLGSGATNLAGQPAFTTSKVITYSDSERKYAIDICLARIGVQYGKKLMHSVKLMLDYN